MKQAIFRCDASPGIGGGHVFRCLTLADFFHERGWSCTFLCSPETPETVSALKHSVYKIITADELCPDPSLLAAEEIQANLVVFDHYGLDRCYEELWREYAECLFVLDDLADRPHDCDLLLDQTYGRDATDYKARVPENCKVLAGVEYALLRAQFSDVREKVLFDREKRKGRLEHLLVSMGSTNIHNITGTVLDALRVWSDSRLSIDVVMGTKSTALDDIRAIVREMNDEGIHTVNLLTDVSDMAALMAKADLAIGAGGTTSWERCCLGLPTVMVEIADNQALIADKLHSAGAVINLGWYKDVTVNAIQKILSRLAVNSHEMVKLSNEASRLCDGLGVIRVFDAVQENYDG